MTNKPVTFITVKHLEEKSGMGGRKIRKLLRENGIKPKKTPVQDGWPNQQRNQYFWLPSDPELKKVTKILRDFLEKEQQKQQNPLDALEIR